MLIQPNTEIRILRNCPLNNRYEHTIYFENESEQVSYFRNLTKHILTKQSYQRHEKGVLTVQLTAEALFDCNYIMFKNSSFENKWFYAFITSVEYVNNVTTRISYELDIMQTWFFEAHLQDCFVIREHSKTDNLFENLVPENLDLGDEYVVNRTEHFDMNKMAVCFLAVPIDGNVQGRTINNVYTPLDVRAGVFVDSPDAIDALVKEYVEKGQTDRIAVIYQYPEFLGDATTTNPVTKDKTIIANTSLINGYAPHNKKLFNHPYNFLLVSNNSGETAEYKWENWNAYTRGAFNISGVFVSSPSVMCYPKGYRGIQLDYDSGLTLTKFPQCAWIGDTFKEWWAQNKASTEVNLANSLLSAGLTIGTIALNPAIGSASVGTQFLAGASAIGSLASAEKTISSTIAKAKDLKNTPPTIHGQTQIDSLNAGIGRIKFSFYCMTIKEQFARIIDNYFDVYGYATHITKKPNRHVRNHWTYTKTAGCVITGSIPSDDISNLCAIYDNGITFWDKDSVLGDYSVASTNTPIEGV